MHHSLRLPLLLDALALILSLSLTLSLTLSLSPGAWLRPPAAAGTPCPTAASNPHHTSTAIVTASRGDGGLHCLEVLCSQLVRACGSTAPLQQCAVQLQRWLGSNWCLES